MIIKIKIKIYNKYVINIILLYNNNYYKLY